MEKDLRARDEEGEGRGGRAAHEGGGERRGDEKRMTEGSGGDDGTRQEHGVRDEEGKEAGREGRRRACGSFEKSGRGTKTLQHTLGTRTHSQDLTLSICNINLYLRMISPRSARSEAVGPGRFPALLPSQLALLTLSRKSTFIFHPHFCVLFLIWRRRTRGSRTSPAPEPSVKGNTCALPRPPR